MHGGRQSTFVISNSKLTFPPPTPPSHIRMQQNDNSFSRRWVGHEPLSIFPYIQIPDHHSDVGVSRLVRFTLFLLDELGWRWMWEEAERKEEYDAFSDNRKFILIIMRFNGYSSLWNGRNILFIYLFKSYRHPLRNFVKGTKPHPYKDIRSTHQQGFLQCWVKVWFKLHCGPFPIVNHEHNSQRTGCEGVSTEMSFHYYFPPPFHHLIHRT